jgi:hypothetical protein
MNQHKWKDEAPCLGRDTNDFFDKYEEVVEFRSEIDALCQSCPFRRVCFATGVSTKGWGVWGGIYLERGEISREFGNHRTKEDWAQSWQALTTE